MDPIVEALLGGYYVVDDLAAALAAPVVDGVTYVTPDGARVSCGGLVRVGLDAGEASGASGAQASHSRAGGPGARSGCRV